jgi:putative ABC transport system substrate-binding protein
VVFSWFKSEQRERWRKVKLDRKHLEARSRRFLCPGGNITGFTNFEPAMGGKWLEVLREAAPATARVLVIMHPETPAHKEFWQAIEELAGPLHIEAIAAGVHNPPSANPAPAWGALSP